MIQFGTFPGQYQYHVVRRKGWEQRLPAVGRAGWVSSTSAFVMGYLAHQLTIASTTRAVTEQPSTE